MSGVFSFIKHPILGLLEKSTLLIPGMDKAIALYFDSATNQLVCKSIEVKNHNKPAINDFLIKDIPTAQALRNRNIQYRWMATDNLPFETGKSNKKQLDIFDELNNVVLCLGFKNSNDQHADLLFLYLNHNKGNFGLSNSIQKLTTSEKSIIGTMAYNSCNVYIKQQKTDSETLKLINQKVKLLHHENEKQKKQLINLKENYLSSIVEMCNIHLNKLTDEYGIKFCLSVDAIEKLQYFTGNIDDLKEKLTQSAVVALNLNFGQGDNQITLNAWDIDFSNSATAINDNQPDVHNRYQKTLHLLNKLENAARIVLNKQQRLTSVNVGNACPSPISAPAISDALKNHHKKLSKLMNEYPHKWPTIRNEFRPVKNILYNSNVG